MRRTPVENEYVYVSGAIGIVERVRGYNALQDCALVRFANGTAQYIDHNDLLHASDGPAAWVKAKAAEATNAKRD